jgi:hypothetical protein
VIVALAAVASAGTAEVAIEVPWRTVPVRGWVEDAAVPGLSPARLTVGAEYHHLVGGLRGNVEVFDVKGGDGLLDGSVRAWLGRFDLAGRQVEASSYEAALNLAFRSSNESEAGLGGYGIAGAGVMASMLRTSLWPTHINPGVTGFAGFGLEAGGATRVVLETRLSLGLRADYYEAHAQLPDAQIGYRYYPGHAGIFTSLGVRWSTRRQARVQSMPLPPPG